MVAAWILTLGVLVSWVAPIRGAQAASAADLQMQMSTQTRRMEVLYRSLQVRLVRAGAEGKNTEAMRSALEQELTRHAESMTLLQQQLLVARGLKSKPRRSGACSVDDARLAQKLIVSAAPPAPSVNECFDAASCETGKYCKTVKIQCLGPAAIRELAGPGAAALCDQAGCEVILAKRMCEAFDLKDGMVIDPGNTETAIAPESGHAVYETCVTRHELRHAFHDPSTCPNCKSEAIAFDVSAQCMRVYRERHCSAETPKDHRFTDYACKFLQEQIDFHKTGSVFNDCLCKSRIEGFSGIYESGTCQRCLKESGTHESMAKLYCQGREIPDLDDLFGPENP